MTLVALLASACASVPYEYGVPPAGPRANPLRSGEPQFERGRPHRALDILGNIFGLPSKILLLNWRMENHSISPEVEEALCAYLQANELDHVKVRINQYAPGREWKRLARNGEMSGAWRWTLGMLNVLIYTILPQRVFGGDNYNPYTNTISIYSDVRPVTIHEGGHAKDFAHRRWKGLYAAIRLIPIVPLWQEGWASQDAISYERVAGNEDDEKRAYRALYPAYGTYVGGEAADWLSGSNWVVYAVQYGAVAVGHVVGWTRSFFVPGERERDVKAGRSQPPPPPLSASAALHCGLVGAGSPSPGPDPDPDPDPDPAAPAPVPLS